MEQLLDKILNNETKLRILRLFTSRSEGYQAAGREVARLVEVTAPTAHAALKELYDQHILSFEIIGRNHVYRLNREYRTVQEILLPAFKGENRLKDDMFQYILRVIAEKKIEQKIIAIILYGSRQAKLARAQSDVDIAVVVGLKEDVAPVNEVFIDEVSPAFFEYFGVSLDAYVKSKRDFFERKKKDLPPVSTMRKAYEVIYGEDILK